MTDVITFDDFRPGANMGHATDVVDEHILDLWKQLYPWDTVAAGELPPGLATVLLMRAYMRILTPRPPGNIHARQRMELELSQPRLPGLEPEPPKAVQGTLWALGSAGCGVERQYE